jgi:hypothetical protein
MGASFLVTNSVFHPASHIEIGIIISRKSGKYIAQHEKKRKKDSCQKKGFEK